MAPLEDVDVSLWVLDAAPSPSMVVGSSHLGKHGWGVVLTVVGVSCALVETTAGLPSAGVAAVANMSEGPLRGEWSVAVCTWTSIWLAFHSLVQVYPIMLSESRGAKRSLLNVLPRTEDRATGTESHLGSVW